MRPVDVARQAGVSTQTVRNLEAAGVLPMATRTRSGYRTYTAEHLSALLTYRALAAGHGSPVAQAIMIAVGRGKLSDALALVDASHAAMDRQRHALDETSATLTALTQERRGDLPIQARGIRVGELARRLGVRPSTLRVWEDAGLLAPAREKGTGYRLYSTEDVRDSQLIHLLRHGGYQFDRIRPVIEGIRHTGSADALHAAVKERRAALHARALALLAGAGRLRAHLDDFFDEDQDS